MNWSVKTPLHRQKGVARSRLLAPPGELTYKSDRDPRKKIKIKPLRETYVGVAQAQSDPWRRPYQNRQYFFFFVNFFLYSPKRYEQI